MAKASNTTSSKQMEFWETGIPSVATREPIQETLFSAFQLEALQPSVTRRTKTPVAQTAAPEPTQSRGILDQGFASRRPLNILVADDNEINRKVIRVILQKLGYHCVEAANGEEAVEHYNSGAYDYIFMDLDMPEMDGISAAQAIRAIEENEPRRAEIIAVTANVSDDTRQRCRRAGMNGYLEKPITAAMIKNQLLRSWPRIRSRRK